ncbi:MAG: hypothetical protein M5R36_05175 [Deltaproteobacteria bacterium]|nr:hypothetical protein [Deltaproteobacteria bacterium]
MAAFVASPPGTVAMDLYGRTLVAAAAGLVAAWIAHTIAGRATKSSEDEGIPIIFSFLLIAFAAAAAYFVFTLAFRTPQGIVLPGVTP